MSANAWTPGPWLYREGELLSHDAVGFREWVVTPAIISLSDPDEDGRATVILDAEDLSKGDARLIAAAPDLAEALEAMIETMNAQIRAGIRWDQETVDGAKAALAKARS